MANLVGKCPNCQDGIVYMNKKNVRGMTTKVYPCSNNKVITNDGGDTWEQTSVDNCSFVIFGNALLRYGKRSIETKEVKNLLNNKEVIVRLFSKHSKKEYFKYLLLSKEYGVTVDWESEVTSE